MVHAIHGQTPQLANENDISIIMCKCDVSYNNLTYWFRELKDYVREVKQADILQDLIRIYNCDETGFALALKMKKVIASKRDKHVYQGGTTSKKTQITILLATSATAHYVKLLCAQGFSQNVNYMMITITDSLKGYSGIALQGG